MEDSILLKSLGKLSKKQLNTFEAFTQSPYFNKHKKTIELLLILKKLYPFKKANLLKKQLIYKQLFPNQAFNEQALKDLMSYLLKLLQQFLAIEVFKTDQYLEQLNTLKQSAHLGLDELVERKSKNLKSQLEKNKQLNSELYQYELNLLLDQYTVKNKKKTNTDYLKKAVNSLDQFYLNKRTQLIADMMNRNNIIGAVFDLNAKNEVFKLAQKIEQGNNGFFKIYQSIVKLLDVEKSDELYNELINLIEQNTAFLDEPELKEIYSYARNYCVKQINNGNNDYLQKLFELYQALLSNNLLLNNNIISQWNFMNIVTLGLRLKAFDWTAEFIDTYKNNLNKAEYENAYNYNLANFYYHRQAFDKAQKLLLDVSFTDVFYDLNSRSMLLKIYMEEKEYYLLESLANTFKLFLLRNKSISTYQKKSHNNLIRFTLKLARIKENAPLIAKSETQAKLKKLNVQINSTATINNKTWLLEQLEAI